MVLGALRAVVVVVVVAGCCFQGAQGVSPPAPLRPLQPGILLPYVCPLDVTLTKIMINQSDSGYVQLVEYETPIPSLTSFTIHYWFNLADLTNTSTLFNYALDPSLEGERLSVKLESFNGGQYHYLTLAINGAVVSQVTPEPYVRTGQWYHALHSWDSTTGITSHFLNGRLLFSRQIPRTQGWVIQGGGFAQSGQTRNARFVFMGMDQGEGMNGWLTLFQLSSKAIGIPYSSAETKAKLAYQCSAEMEGDVISWTTTPRKGYGGVTETPSYSKACGRF